MRRHDEVVAADQMRLAHELFQLLAEDAALGVPDPQAGPELLGAGEQVELATQAAMVASYMPGPGACR